jgi:succinoglycan biosynthesis protein ExoA
LSLSYLPPRLNALPEPEADSRVGTLRPADELVTVVIPARDEERMIGACLDSVLRQDYENLEVIVVDGASHDGTKQIVLDRAARDSRVRLLHNPDQDIPKSLNLALAQSRGRWFVRVDGHAAIAPGYIRRAVAHLRDGGWGGVGGRKEGVGRTSAGKAVAAAMASPFGVGNSTYHYGKKVQEVEHVPFGAYPVDLLRELEGWNERLPVNQDFEVDFRIRERGRRLLFDPDLVIEWDCRQSLSAFFQQYRRYGRGKSVVAVMHPASVRLRHLAAPVFLATLGGTLVAAVVWPWGPLVPVGAYALGVALATAVARVDGWKPRLLLPLAFGAMHIGWGAGFWEGLFEQAFDRLRRR